MTHQHDQLPRMQANDVALSPISFLNRAAQVYAQRTAVIDGERRISYHQLHRRCCQLAGLLSTRGLTTGDVVATLGVNSLATLEAHYGVPMMGGILNAINTRLDGESVAFILNHGGARALIHDRRLRPLVHRALEQLEGPVPLLIEIDDGSAASMAAHHEALDYETALSEAPHRLPEPPADEWAPITLNYTSGTTGNPRGVLYSHRGAYLNALSNTLTLGLDSHSVYLWTLPMFHCNGWTHTWAVTAAGGTHLCLDRIDPQRIFTLIAEQGVTHLSAAPVILTMLLNAPAEQRRQWSHKVTLATGGAAPASSTVKGISALGFHVLHLYGMTETYGPSLVCEWQPHWDELTGEECARLQIRQGVGTVSVERVAIRHPETHREVPADGVSQGHLMLRANTIMKGYLDNPEATRDALGSGWLDTGDIAVMHPDGYIEIRDRARDIILSGGESISSIELEEILMRHPAIMEVAVVAHPHPHWGETPHAFVTLAADAEPLDETTVIAWCRDHMAHFKVPGHVTFEDDLPKTSTGKLQKYLLRQRQEFADTPLSGSSP